MSLLSKLFGVDDEQARGDALDAQLREINTRDYSPGGKLYTPENWEVVQQHLESSQTGDVDQELNQAFVEGAKEGLQNEKSAVNGFFANVLGAVPASVWIILAVAGFIYFGGLDLIKRKVANA